jgi:hypothetical protein
MLIIFGTDVKNKEITDYDFEPAFCPHCHEKLKIIESSRWLSLFFLSVFKIETLGFYYLCTVCNTEYSSNQLHN